MKINKRDYNSLEMVQKHKDYMKTYLQEYRQTHKEEYREYFRRRNKRRRMKRLGFKGKDIQFEKDVRVGVCNWCRAVVPFDTSRTHLHHDNDRYDNNNPLRFTIELCSKCHGVETTRLIPPKKSSISIQETYYWRVRYNWLCFRTQYNKKKKCDWEYGFIPRSPI